RSAPDECNTVVKPMGESFAPAPSVGYSRITVLEDYLQPDESGGWTSSHQPNAIKGNGVTIHKFFTAYDFPVQFKETELDAKPFKPDLLSALADIFTNSIQNYMAVSQGYAVELNDMHGKPKGKVVKEEVGDRKSVV